MISNQTLLPVRSPTMRRLAAPVWQPLLALFLLMLISGGPVAAQDMRDMQNEVSRLRQDVADLQRQRAGGGRAPAGAASTSGVVPVGSETPAAQVKVQVDQMDMELRGMVGQIEQVTFQVNQVNSRLEKLVADMDFRLNALEHGGGGAASQPSGSQPSMRPQGGLQPDASPSRASQSSRPVQDIGASLSELPPPPSAVNSTLQNSRTPPPPPGIAAATPKGSPDEQYAAAFGLLRAGDYIGASDGMEQFVKNNPTHELAGNATYWLGETYYVRKDYAKAATYFLDGFQKYPQSRKGPDNLLKLGMTLAALDHKTEACQALIQVAKKYPSAAEKITQRASAEIRRLSCS
ncbi:MAG: tol-pal system protein YbgF [Alphaproteobacteria bacterium]|nr:tol-pal system protein YbgF [Alphaproteobacteria bacterium]